MRKNILFLIIFLTFETLQAQYFSNIANTIYEDIEISICDGLGFITAPTRMDNSDALLFTGVGLSTFYMIHHDGYIRSLLNSEVDEYQNNFWIALEAYGVVQYAEAIGGLTYSIGLFAQHEKTRVLGRMIIQSLTYSGATAMFMRMIAGRKRPPFTKDPLNFIGFTTNNSYQSFPSGHTTVAFALSTVLAEYFDETWSRILFYGIAGLSATERYINNSHWFTDIALGAALGYVSGLYVINSEKKRNNNSILNNLSISPTLNGISLIYRLN
ncbi:MAG: hypothetical protein CR986_00120 [Ignavibacteriae bacterium]|nr:MAG: hypothetical protein CR986_00120 [Ignavibacteriota bacterium]